MDRHFDDDLNKFHANIAHLATLTEQAIEKSISALKNQDVELAKSVIESDKVIDEMENMIEEQGIDLLALYQPMAIDLRYITTGIHINAEMERIADMAVNICYKVIDLADQPLLKPLIDIPRLSEIARTMVKQAIDSFILRNEQLAKEVILLEPQADNLRNFITKELVYDYMVRDGSTVPRGVPLLLITRDLERICDHATNIAEDVIYMIRAVIVKHHPEKIQNNQII